MANAGKTIVKIKAPVMLVQTQNKIKEPVWMEKDFFPNLLDLIKEYKINIKGFNFMNNHIKIYFEDYKNATKFRLVYEGKEYK